MSSSNKSCSCGCSPCSCGTPPPCGPDLCVPRPCFFNGQLITADDLNAVMAYFRAKEAMLARFVGGWGILGGLRVARGIGVPAAGLSTQTISPNPQILAGTVVQVLPGAGIDASGRTLTVCSAKTLDLMALAAESPGASQTQTCAQWFAPQSIPLCTKFGLTVDGGSKVSSPPLEATAYWLVAEYTEAPSRPVPQFAGGGPCDPAPSCDFSRKIEDVRFRLVPRLPPSYFLTGCLDAASSPLLPAVTLPPASGGGQATNPWSQLQQPALAGMDESSVISACTYQVYAAMDAIGEAVAGACCASPALVLGRVLFTSSPGALQGSLPPAPVYVILQDGYPYRRIIPSAALELYLTASLACPVITS